MKSNLKQWIFDIIFPLVVIILVMSGIYLVAPKIIDIDNNAMLQILNSSSSIIIAIVTTYYVLFTYKIVKQTNTSIKQAEIDREIAFIERKLEILYHPLRYILNKNITIEPTPIGMNAFGEDIREHQIMDIKPFIDSNQDYGSVRINIYNCQKEDFEKLIAYIYLVDEDIREDVCTFLALNLEDKTSDTNTVRKMLKNLTISVPIKNKEYTQRLSEIINFEH